MRALAPVIVLLLLLGMIAPATAQEYGSISGIVTAANNAAVPGAIVTLWVEGDGMAYVANNPQYTSGYESQTPGMYTFTNVPPGTYNISAAIDGHWYYTVVNVVGGTATGNIVIPDFNYTPQAFTPPSPTPKTYYTFVPIHIAPAPPQKSVSRSPGFDAPILLAALSMALYLRKRLSDRQRHPGG